MVTPFCLCRLPMSLPEARSGEFIETKKCLRSMRTIQSITFFALILLIPSLFSCDHGLDPEAESSLPGIDGTVTVVDDWTSDSAIRGIYVVVFKSIPQDSADAVNQFFSGAIKFVELTPPHESVYSYSFDLDPGTYQLVACIGVRGDLFFNVANWVLTGIYTVTNNPFDPSPVTISESERITNIDMMASVRYTLPLPF